MLSIVSRLVDENEEVGWDWFQGNLTIIQDSLALEEAWVSTLDSLALQEVWT